MYLYLNPWMTISSFLYKACCTFLYMCINCDGVVYSASISGDNIIIIICTQCVQHIPVLSVFKTISTLRTEINCGLAVCINHPQTYQLYVPVFAKLSYCHVPFLCNLSILCCSAWIMWKHSTEQNYWWPFFFLQGHNFGNINVV
jgi:hypothetical protein